MFKKIGSFLLMGVILGGFIWVMVLLFWSQQNSLRVTVLDGNNPGNILIQTPVGHTIVIQTTRDANLSQVLSVSLPFYQRYIDLFVFAELNILPDDKVMDLFDQYEFGLVVLPSGLPASGFAKTIQKKLQEKKIPFELVDHAQMYEFVEESFPEVKLQLLYPGSWQESFVPVLVTYDQTCALMSGPVNTSQQQMLLSSFPQMKPCDLLVYPKSVTLQPEFLKSVVKPQGVRVESTSITKKAVFVFSGADVTKK